MSVPAGTSALTVSLLPLPKSLDARQRLAPLRREVVQPLYPPKLHGPERA